MLHVCSLLPCGHHLVCDVYCDFVTFPFGILGQVWYMIVLIPDPCCLSYFQSQEIVNILKTKSNFTHFNTEYIYTHFDFKQIELQ